MAAQTHILIVDDYEPVAEALALSLQDVGFPVAVAHAWEAARSICEQQTIDVVISDLQLPGLADAEIVSLLHAHYPARPILAMSGCDDTRARVLALAAGARDFLAKPANPERIISALAAIIGRPFKFDGPRAIDV